MNTHPTHIHSQEKHGWFNCMSSSLSDSLFLSISLLFIRLFFGASMLTHGMHKLLHFEELMLIFPDPLHVGSTFSLLMILFAELLCSILIMLGFLTRFAALPLIFGMGMAAFVIHAGQGFASMELALLYLVGFVTLFLSGAGQFSFDYWLFRKRKSSCSFCSDNA